MRRFIVNCFFTALAIFGAMVVTALALTVNEPIELAQGPAYPQTRSASPARNAAAAAPVQQAPPQQATQANHSAPAELVESEGEEAADPMPAAEEKPVALPATSEPAKTVKWCDLYISADNPRDVLVINAEGQYMQDVRQAYVWFQLGMKQPSVRLYRWAGIYKPSNAAESDTWGVRSMHTVDATKFQQIVDTGKAPE